MLAPNNHSQSFELSPARDRIVRGRVDVDSSALQRFEEAGEQVPVVVLVHGFASFMQWGFFPALSQRLVQSGFACVRFDMSGNGVGPDLESFTEPEAFACDTYAKELEDLGAVRAHLGGGAYEFLDLRRLSLLGHSRGAGIALIHAAERPGIRSLVGWATIAQVASWTPERKRLWREQGYLEVPCRGGWQRLELDVLEDAERHPDRYDLAAVFARIHCPVLLVHGTRDRGVPIDAIRRLLSHFPAAAARLAAIDGAGHGFGARHPLGDIPVHLELAMTESITALLAANAEGPGLP